MSEDSGAPPLALLLCPPHILRALSFLTRRTPREPMIPPTILIVALLPVVILGHEICLSSSSPKEGPLSFCLEYDGYSCCSVSEDSHLESLWHSMLADEGK
jgi:hypothetical protein